MFLLGLIIGSVCGAVIMCLFVVSSQTDERVSFNFKMRRVCDKCGDKQIADQVRQELTWLQEMKKET